MELAASSLYRVTGEASYEQQAFTYAKEEEVTPWIGRDTVRHYQYYPFINAGHHELASVSPGRKKILAGFYKKGLEKLYERGKKNPFLIGIPFVWCSNNLVTAAVSQARFYHKLSGDERYLEMEAALRDWLLGCNPWGTSMVVGLPGNGDSPQFPHSSLLHLEGFQTDGGLVDGPVYGSIYNNLIGLQLHQPDSYAPFQSELVVYHDDVGDYSTNEPTMDGTASLIYYLSSLEAEGQKSGRVKRQFSRDETGAIRKGPGDKKELTLIFSGDEYAEGGDSILLALDRYNIKAAFFLTGNFYRKHPDFIQKAKASGHYLGAHSDKHLLYNDWSAEKKLLVSRKEFQEDLMANYREMEKAGIDFEQAPYFLPPYEWNDRMISQWAMQKGVVTINYSRGTLSHADYTLPSDPAYRSSQEIIESIMAFEREKSLNGFLLLSHLGSDPERTDKFYLELDSLIQELKRLGYDLIPISKMLARENGTLP